MDNIKLPIKPRPHQQQRRSYIDKCYNVERCIDIVAKKATVLSGSGPNVARGIVIPYRWSRGLTSVARARGLELRAIGKFKSSRRRRIERRRREV